MRAVSAQKNQIPEAEWAVADEQPGTHLDRLVKAQFPELSWNTVRGWIRGGNVLVNRAAVLDPTAMLTGELTIVVTGRPSEKKDRRGPRPSVVAPKLLVFYDSQLAVVEKPAGISTVPYDSEERDTLDRRVMAQLARMKAKPKLLTVHRIDKETTGLLVFARTQTALERLKSQFRLHTVQRKYLALVHGKVRSQTIKSQLVTDRGDGLRGSTQNPRLGRAAVTHVRVIEHLAGASLVECELETGRTHQIRIHLSEAGHPLLGERVYSKGYQGQLLAAPRVMLHAASLGFDHPTEAGRRLQFQSETPSDFAQTLRGLK
jgi:23S rRNA pseudouridine1911/1915/1917 synthase